MLFESEAEAEHVSDAVADAVGWAVIKASDIVSVDARKSAAKNMTKGPNQSKNNKTLLLLPVPIATRRNN